MTWSLILEQDSEGIAFRWQKPAMKVDAADLSKHLLEELKESAKVLGAAQRNINVIQVDMRTYSATSKYDAVILMFTTFGYFKNEKDHTKVLQNIFNSLKPGGKLLLDLPNIPKLLSRKDVDLPDFTITHRFDQENKRWELTQHIGKEKLFSSVRIFTEVEILSLLRDSGLIQSKVYGDLKGNPLTKTSQRMMVVAMKPF